MASSVPRALIIGGPSSGKKSVASGVLALAAGVSGVAPTFSPTLPVGALCAPLALSTKYYSATVEIVVLPASAFVDPDGDAWAGAHVGVEAAVLVVDATAPFAVSNASAWAQRLTDVPTLLIIATYVDSLPAASRGSALAALSEWALDNGFELVEANAIADPKEADVDARDKSGVPRVLEALESTMWSNIVRGGAPASSVAASAEGAAVSEGSAAVSEGSAASALPPSSRSLDGLPGCSEPQADADEGMDAADFGALLDEARAVRDLARSGAVDDDARRRAAATVAEKILRLLESGGLGDE